MRRFLYRFTILALLTLSCLLLMLQSQSVHEHFALMLSEKLTQKSGLPITVRDWALTFPCSIELKQIDVNTPHCNIENLTCTIPLLSSSWKFTALSIDTLRLENSAGGGPLPPSLNIARLQIKQLIINDMRFAIEGSLRWNKERSHFSSTLKLNEFPFHLTMDKGHIFAISTAGSLSCDLLLSSQSAELKQLSIESDFINLHGEGALNFETLALSSALTLTAFSQDISCRLSGTVYSPEIEAKFDKLTLQGGAQWKSENCPIALKLSSTDWEEAIHLHTTLFSPQTLDPYTLSFHSKKFSLHSEGAWKIDFSGFALYVDSLNGDYAAFPFELNEPVMIRNLECSPLFFSFAGGTVHTTVDYKEENVHLALRTLNLPSEFFELWLPPLPVTTTISMEANLHGSLKALKGQIQLDLERMKVLDETYLKLPPLKAHCLATLKEDRLECSGTIIGAGPYPMTLTASLPFACQLWPPRLAIDQHTPLNAALTASGEIAPYLQLFFSDTTNIKGQAAIAFSLEGTLANPQVAGELTLENGSFESFTTGTLFENISAKIVGRGSQVQLAKFSADTNKVKTVTATGSLLMDHAQHYPFQIAFNTHNAPLLQNDLTTIVTSGQLLLKGNCKEAFLSGDLGVDRAHFELPKQLPPSIKEVKITYINQPDNEEPPTTYSPKSSLFPIALDIRLHAQHGVFLTGKELTTEWKGETFIRGTLTDPLLFGQVEAIKGEQMINGKKFELMQGNITFAGNYTDKATLYAIAAHEIDDISAEIVLKGPVNNPLISLRSNPPLSQPEILSLILFNKPLPEISSLQGAELNQTFSALHSSADEGADFLGKLRKTFKIDRIEFSHSDENDISVKVGKYVTPNVLVLVNKSMTTDAKSLEISANLIKSFKLQAEIDEDANSHLRLKWKRDY